MIRPKNRGISHTATERTDLLGLTPAVAGLSVAELGEVLEAI